MVARNQQYSFNAGMDMETGMSKATPPPQRKSCWRRRTALERALIIASVILTALVIAVIVIMAIFAEAAQNETNCDPKKTKSGKKADGTAGLQMPNEQENGKEVESHLLCNTHQCVDVAHRMIHSMDQSVDPCKNFHKYACGGWQKANTISDATMRSVFSDEMVENVNNVLKTLLEMDEQEVDPADDLVAFQKARAFYRSCMIESTIKKRGFQPAKNILDTIGKIYDEDTWSTDEANLTDLIYGLLTRNGAPFFDISTDVHPGNSSRKSILISLPSYSGIISEYKYRVFMHRAMEQSLFEAGMMSPEESENTTDSDYAEFFSLIQDMNVTIDGAFLYKYMRITINKKTDDKMFSMLRSYFKREANDTRQAALEKELENFISDLRDYTPTPKQQQIADAQGETDKIYAIGELRYLLEEVDWKILLEKLYKRSLGNDETVLVAYPTYLKDLQKLFKKFGPRVINNAALALYSRDVLWELIYSEEGLERWEFCVDATKMVIPQALAAMYVRSFSREYLQKIENEVKIVFENIKRSFKKIISSSSWMDSFSKEKIKLKLDTMSGSFVSSDVVYNNTFIEMSVKNITIDKGRFFENVLAGYELSRLETYDPNYNRSMSKSKVEESIMGNPFTINAYYLHSFNNVAITLGLLSPPYYALHQPKFVTYGSLGTTIGHEITHGFDTTGINYNEYGNKIAWMPSETSQRYQARGDCFRTMYETTFQQTVEFLGGEAVLRIDGNYTLNENLADNLGIEIAFEAYKSLEETSSAGVQLPGLNLTQDQVFFLSAAQSSCVIMTPVAYIFTLELDEHTPEPERVNAFLMNSDKFATAFQCPSGSPMNPKTKCRMW